MLKITTDMLAAANQNDPEDYYEVDLTRPDGSALRPAFVGEVEPVNTDLTFQRPDGGVNVYHRSRVARHALQLDFLDYEQAAALERLRARRQLVRLFPNFDRSTFLWAPLTGTLNAVRLSAGDWLPSAVTNLSTGRNEAAYTPDPDRGLLIQSPAGQARFLQGPVGPRVLQESGRANLATNPHPLSGTLIWTPSGSAGTVVWDTDEPSPAIGGGYAGVARMPYTADLVNSAAWTYTESHGDSSTGDWWRATVWLKGAGTVRLVGLFALGNSAAGDYVELSPYRWKPVTVTLEKTDPATTFRLDIQLQGDSNPTSHSDRIYSGPVMIEKGPAAKTPPTTWTDQPADVTDDITWTCHNSAGAYSVAWLGVLPENDTKARCWRLNGSGVNFLTQFETAGTLRHYLNTSETISVVIPDAPGAPYYASVVVDLSTNRARMVLKAAGQTLEAEQQGDGDFISAGRVITGASVGDTAANGSPAGDTGVQHLRMDRRAWSPAEQDLHARSWMHDGTRRLMHWAHGRLFRIVDVPLQPRPENTAHLVGTLTLEEVNRDTNGWVWQQ